MGSLALAMRPIVARHSTLSRALLGCGVVATAWWIAIDVVGSLRYAGYSYFDQTISELSAEGAPTARFMTVISGIPYTALMIAFGVGVWAVAGGSRAGRITGAVLIGEAVWGFAGGVLFPMAVRGSEESLRNEMHPIYGIGMPILFLVAVGFGSRLLGKKFRYYSYGTIVAAFACGFLVAVQAPQVAADEPTPWLGLEERINAYLSMLWIAALAVGLLRAQRFSASRPFAQVAGTPHALPR